MQQHEPDVPIRFGWWLLAVGVSLGLWALILMVIGSLNV